MASWKKTQPSSSRPVYSTDSGRLCSGCGRPADDCSCSSQSVRPPDPNAVVRVRLEVKGRRGKSVTTVAGVPLPPEEIRRLATELKRRCGAGGALKDGVIEIQGDHRTEVVADLEKRGFRVRR